MKKQTNKEQWWRILTSMRTGILLLIALGALASLGTLIPQGAPSDFYLEHYGLYLGKFILFFALDHLYSSWGFLALGGFFSLNLFFCSVRRLKTLKQTRDAGSVFLHLSILVIFLGSAISAGFTVSGDVKIAVGETLDLAEAGFPGYSLTVRDFRIEYYDTLEPRQYKSNLVLKSKAGNSVGREIMVNHPFKYQGLKIYQQSYGWQVSGLITDGSDSRDFKLKDGEELILKPQEDLVLKTIFIPDFDEKTQSLKTLSNIPNNPVMVCALLQGEHLLQVEFLAKGEKKDLGQYTVDFKDYRYYSGLNVKKDPGVKLIFGGFFMMTISFLLRYLVPVKTFPKEDHSNGNHS